MIIKISHKTKYNFTSTVPSLVQSLKLYPTNCKNQKILNWKISSSRGKVVDSYIDALGHKIVNIYNNNIKGEQEILSTGKVETKNYFGTFAGFKEKVNSSCFLRFTSLTNPGKKIIDLSKKIKKKKNEVDFCHDLNIFVSDVIKYKSNTTDNSTSAEMALEKGEGVCQDFAHILIALAKVLNLPARYVNGYLIEDRNAKDYFSHAWVEIFVKDLGWVAFDPSHKKCIDDKYVRISCGFDFIDASPIKGVKLNYLGNEDLNFKLNMEECDKHN